MRSNHQQENQTLTPMQKQAVLVCIVCALAALLTIGITLTMLKRGKNPAEQPGDSSIITPAPAPEGEEDISDHYQINETSSALLTGTADAGDAYQEQTLFIGDSNTVRLYANGLISLQQFCAKEGIGTSAALNEGIVTFKRDDNRYTIAQAVAKMKPRRVVIMLGTNDNGMSTEDFISYYTALVQAIQASYPYTDIIVNTVPPVPSNHSNYPNMDQTRIDDFNMALLTMCEQLGVKFLNSAEALKDANGYGNVDYYQSGDIHLKPAGLKVLLKYLRTHAYETEDRRPDTNNIPTRAEYTANPSSAVEAPSSSEAVSSVVEEKTEYQADYRVDKAGGGSLTCGDESGKSLAVKVTSAAQSVTVTAVPEDGYVFVKWSDGVTKRTRTDTNFDQNVDVTAVFAAASIQVSSSGKAGLGDSYTFKATLKGKYLDASSIRWYVNGTEVTQAAGKTTVKGEVDPSMVGGTFRVYATASYNDCTVTSNKLELTVSGGTSGSSSSSSSSSASSKEDKPASSKEETSSSKEEKPASSKEEKPASSKEEKPASSTSNGTSESTGSSSKVEKPASSAASSKEEKTASSSQSSTSSKGETSSSSKQEHTVSSKEEKPASSKEEKPASSKEEKPASSKTEASASKEAAN